MRRLFFQWVPFCLGKVPFGERFGMLEGLVDDFGDFVDGVWVVVF